VEAGPVQDGEGVPEAYGPLKTLYNRFVRWSRKGAFDRIFESGVSEGPAAARAGGRGLIGDVLDHGRYLGQNLAAIEPERRHVALRVDARIVRAALGLLRTRSTFSRSWPRPASPSEIWAAREQVPGA
jgi:hypothetical protein